MPPEIKRLIAELSARDETPQWQIIVKAIACYVRHGAGRAHGVIKTR